MSLLVLHFRCCGRTVKIVLQNLSLHHFVLGPGKLLIVGVRDFADLRPKNRQIYVPFLRI